ncbi:phosphotransferase family protein [Streptomyces orinoci]|uniref:Aminoglycoside phosphotransferase family protein n=1 Tax=Streptomyces orinoci TaxID=67339 RepID=A0ABV3JWI5_STRON|nr:aminoglycoside phosphotransferase family protein [Streptomyces orinoci]
MTAPTTITFGGFDDTEMHHVLERACTRVGLDCTGAIRLRGHTNAVVRLITEPVVVKIARRGSDETGVVRTVAFVQWLMKQNFPTAPLHPVAQQPVVVDGHAVTFWTYLPQPEHPVSAVQLAAPLRELHRLTDPPVRLRRLNVVEAIRSSLAATTSLPPQTLLFLADRAERLADELSQVAFMLPEGVVQGDPQHRNALHTKDGGAVLCDWDTVAYGQPEWDLATVEIHCRRFGHGPAHYRQFANAYGIDVTQWPGYRVLRDLRELRMITTNARKAAHAPGTLTEVERRISGLRCEDPQLAWNIL